MAKYLIDPIYAYKEIKDNFILYVKTAFGTRYKSIEALVNYTVANLTL